VVIAYWIVSAGADTFFLPTDEARPDIKKVIDGATERLSEVCPIRLESHGLMSLTTICMNDKCCGPGDGVMTEIPRHVQDIGELQAASCQH